MCNCSEVASILLGDEKWKEMMKQKTQCDNAHPEWKTPLSNLIAKMPGKNLLWQFMSLSEVLCVSDST